MSRLLVTFNILMAMLHAILWLAGIGLYIGFVEEPDSEDDIILHSHNSKGDPEEITLKIKDGYIVEIKREKSV